MELSEKIKQFNNNRYGTYPALPTEAHFFTDKVYLYKALRELKNIAQGRKLRVLEIGCADGSFLRTLEQNNFEAVGIDIAESAITQARADGLEAQVCNTETGIDFKDAEFDAVIACEIIEHLYDTDFFLKEIKRVLKPNGTVIISTPNLASLKNRFRLLFGLYPRYSEYRLGDDTSGHIRNYTPRVLKKQLIANGFSLSKILAPNILFPMTRTIPVFIKKIAIRLGDIFYRSGSHIIIVGRK